MADVPADVPEAELAVLEVLWSCGQATRRQITDILYPTGGPAHYTTVQKLLDRLEKKGYVTCDRSTPIRTFAATVPREHLVDRLIDRRLRDVADKLCGGSLTPLLMNLVKSQPLTSDELQQLRDLIDDLQSPSSSSPEQPR